MAELIAVQGLTLAVDQTTVAPIIVPATTVTATLVMDAPTGTRLKGSTQQVYRDGDTFRLTNVSSSIASIPDPASVPPLFLVGTIPATATRTSSEGELVLRQGDLSATVSANPLDGTTPKPVTFKCEISVAGQVKASAN